MAAETFVAILKEAGRDPTREKHIDSTECMGLIDLGDFQLRFSGKHHEESTFVELVLIGRDGKFGC